MLVRARELDVESQLLDALRSDVRAMCVGPVTAQPWIRQGVPTSSPERMRLGALVRHMADELPLLRSRIAKAAGHVIESGQLAWWSMARSSLCRGPGWQHYVCWLNVPARW